jgi:hypothetical protein
MRNLGFVPHLQSQSVSISEPTIKGSLDDPLYLGLRQRRVSDEDMTAFMEEFMLEMSRAFPRLLVQFEVREPDLP